MTLYAPPRHARRAHDFYPTPADLVVALPAGLRRAGMTLPTPVFDCCAGDGAVLDGLGLDGSRGSDLFPDDYPFDPRLMVDPVDARDRQALAKALDGARAIVTNPPYDRDALPIAECAVELVRDGVIEMAALLLPALWETAGSPRRVALMRAMNLRIVACWRPIWIKGTRGGGKLNYAWHVWTRDIPPLPRVIQASRRDVEAYAR